MPPEVEDNIPTLDPEGQRIMAEGLGQAPKPDVLSDDEAQALYKQIYGSAPSADANTSPDVLEPEVLPHQSRTYYMNGMDRANVPQPDMPAEQKFSAEEEELLSNLGKPSPPENPAQGQVDLRTQIALLQDMLAAQQAQPDPNGQQPVTTTPPPPPEESVTPKPPDDAAQKDMITLDNILQQRFGLRLNDVYQQLAYSNQVANYVGHVQALQKVEVMKDQLKSEWGDQYEYRYGKARELYETLPNDQKAHIDKLGVRGAELLWAKAAEDETQPNIPTFDRGKKTNRRSTSHDTGVVSKEELLAMSEEEYSREMRPGGRLWNAAIQGKVNYGI